MTMKVSGNFQPFVERMVAEERFLSVDDMIAEGPA